MAAELLKNKENNTKSNLISWSIFIFLSLVWGSSFKLMKVGMNDLSSYEVASLRILSAGLILLPVTIKHIRTLTPYQIWIVILSGILGNLAPAYFFCIAETKIDSSTAGIINSLMPIFIIFIGKVFFDLKVNNKKIIGVMIAFLGLSALLISKSKADISNIFYLLVATAATLSHGINANVVGKNLKDITSIKIISVGMTILSIPCLMVLFYTGYFNKISTRPEFIISTSASLFLGIFGTAVASALYYILIKRAGSVFASLVTNTMPIVAIFWGVLSGESITISQILCFIVIMSGIYYTNKA